MRIAHVVSTYPPYRGGQGNVAREIAERMVTRGHEVMVVTPSPSASSRAERSEGERSRGIPSDASVRTTPPILRFGNAAWCPSIARTLEEFQPDIVHLHWPFIGGIVPVLAWRARFKVEGNYSLIRTNRSIVESQLPITPQDFHSHFRAKMRMESEPRRLVVQYHMDLVGSGWRGVVFAAYQRRALPRLLAAADHVVVSSLDYARHGALAPYIERLGDRLIEIPLGVDVGRFGAAAGQQGGRAAGLRVLFVGGLDRAHAFKGLSGLLEAIALQKKGPGPFFLRVVGDGDLRATFEARVRVLGISDRVEFLGSVSDAALPGIYRNADVLVLPSTSRSEAFGVVFLEAMASGIPVIASDLPGVRTVVVDGETGFLVPPGDVAALAQRLTMLTRDPEKMREMGAAARRRVEERYAWGHIMNIWGACYASV